MSDRQITAHDAFKRAQKIAENLEVAEPAEAKIAREADRVRRALDGRPAVKASRLPAPQNATEAAVDEAARQARAAHRRSRTAEERRAEAAAEPANVPCAGCEENPIKPGDKRYCATCMGKQAPDEEGADRGKCSACGEQIHGPAWCATCYGDRDEDEDEDEDEDDEENSARGASAPTPTRSKVKRSPLAMTASDPNEAIKIAVAEARRTAIANGRDPGPAEAEARRLMAIGGSRRPTRPEAKAAPSSATATLLPIGPYRAKSAPSMLTNPWFAEGRYIRAAVAVWSRGRLEAQVLAELRAAWEARKASQPRVDEPGAPVEGTGGTLRIVGGVGVLGIEGGLFRHANMLSEYSGGTTYDSIWRGLEAALSAPSVRSILLHLNTPGGEADGLSELARAVAEAAKRKTLWAYVDNLCASAGYWLASQANRIVAEEASEVGSIGVRCAVLDDSKADQMAGLREIEIVSSQSPGKRSSPVDDGVIGRMQTRVNDLAAIFVDAVARGRRVSTKKVLDDFGQGDCMIASKALAAGMIDEIGNFNATLAAMGAA